MKVLLVNGSSHTNGTTMKALEEMMKIFEENEVDTEIIQLGKKPFADCMQCNVCQKTGATPVYFAHPSGRIFSFLDRAFYSNGKNEIYKAFQFKPGASVAVARRGGTTACTNFIKRNDNQR